MLKGTLAGHEDGRRLIEAQTQVLGWSLPMLFLPLKVKYDGMMYGLVSANGFSSPEAKVDYDVVVIIVVDNYYDLMMISSIGLVSTCALSATEGLL